MSKVLVEIELPDAVSGTPLEEKLRKVLSRQALEQAVATLYQKREISTETGANLLGVSLSEFIKFLGEKKVSIFDFDESEWQEELQIVNRVNSKISAENGLKQ